jgi:selenocysteine-specific elongation factor
MGRAVIIEGEVLEPGTEGLVQFRLEAPAVALPGDRFVLRSYSPMMTIGGGYVLDPLPSKHRRGRQVVIDHMRELDTDDPSKRVSVYLSEAGDHGLQASRLAIRSGLTVNELMNVLKAKEEESTVVVAGEGAAALVYSADSFEKLKDRLTKAVARFHESNPAKAGIGREELRMRVARQLPDRPYRNLLSALQEKKEIFIDGDIVKISGHQATLSPQQESLGKKLLELFKGVGLSVPMVPELEEELSVDAKQLKEVLNLLTNREELVRIKDDYFVLPDVHTELIDGIDRYFQADKEMAMPDFREITGTTRKWMIPLLEYLDRTQITMRKGDVRIKRRRSQD